MEWTVVTPIEIGIALIAGGVAVYYMFRSYRRTVLRRLFAIKDELDEISGRKRGIPDLLLRKRQEALLDEAEALLARIGVDPYEHLRTPDARQKRTKGES